MFSVLDTIGKAFAGNGFNSQCTEKTTPEIQIFHKVKHKRQPYDRGPMIRWFGLIA